MGPFETALERTLAFEGGTSDHPLDRGGRTRFGITQVTYDAYRARKGLTARPVDRVEDTEVVEIYHDDYWAPCACDQLPPALAAAVFDMAVNSGPWNARLALQRALRVREDGAIGPVTIKAARDTPDAVLRFLKSRGAFIQEILITRADQVVFLEGWISRLLDQAWRPA